MSGEKLETFLSQLQNGDPAVVVETIVSATESPGVFVFGEFLDHPAVQQLANSPNAAYLDLLNLFCYGSYRSYISQPKLYPPLSALQIRKLKQLAIIDEAHNRRFIPYDFLFEKLELSSSRELEDLVIDLFYLEALSGKLDQQRALLEVDSAIGRDVRLEEIGDFGNTLCMWLNRVESMLSHIAKNIKFATDSRLESELHQKKVQEAAAAVKETLRSQLGKPEMDGPRMDLDDRLVHPDLLDGRSGSTRLASSSVETPGGDKDGRSRMAVFKGLRKGNR
ncbi:unnamed protein product [Dicrocoelium dendriticum]|nr:unnamed protein product [Dicrocoelium dendriticum]